MTALLRSQVMHARFAVAFVLAVVVALIVVFAIVSFFFWFVAAFLYPAAPPYVVAVFGFTVLLALTTRRFLSGPVSWPVGLPVTVIFAAVAFGFAHEGNLGGTLLGAAVTMCALLVTVFREPMLAS